jgi:hypothetical protein
MKNLIASVMALGVMSVVAGCALDTQTSDDATAAPDEAASSSDITIRPRWSLGVNFVRSCTRLALRSCDNPGACDTGVRLAAHTQVVSDFLDSSTHMARLTSPPGWALADLGDEAYLSAVDGPCR